MYKIESGEALACRTDMTLPPCFGLTLTVTDCLVLFAPIVYDCAYIRNRAEQKTARLPEAVKSLSKSYVAFQRLLTYLLMSDLTGSQSTCHNPIGAAKYLKIPAAPAYLNPAGNFSQGANFAHYGASTVPFRANLVRNGY